MHLLTSFGKSQVHRNTPRYADLVQFEIGITGDDRPSRKVDTFTHQVTTQTSFFALQTSTDGFNRTTRLLQRLGDTGDIVVHVCRNVELQAG